MQASDTLRKDESGSPMDPLWLGKESEAGSPTEIREDFWQVGHGFPTGTAMNVINVGQFLLFQFNGTELILCQEGGKGSEVLFKVFFHLSVMRIFVCWSYLAPVLKQAVALNLNDTVAVFADKPNARH